MKKILLYGFKYSNIPERSDRIINTKRRFKHAYKTQK